MKYLYCLALTFIYTFVYTQTCYKGTVGSNSAEMLIYFDEKTDIQANILVANEIIPRELYGRNPGRFLGLYGRNSIGDLTIIEIHNFNGHDSLISGYYWSGEEPRLEINLKKEYEFNTADTFLVEMIEIKSTENHLLKPLVSNTKDHQQVEYINIYDKKDPDSLFQQIKVKCELNNINNIQVEDYNNDGYLDFSLVYKIKNTAVWDLEIQRLYFFRDTTSNDYIQSHIYQPWVTFNKETNQYINTVSCCKGKGFKTQYFIVDQLELELVKCDCYKFSKWGSFKIIKCD